MSNILLTGSSGFVGRHVFKQLIDLGHTVLCWDSMEPQVHPDPDTVRWPRAGEMEVPMNVEFDAVVHLAAKVGVGQSMYEPDQYVECNTLDTAKFLRNLTKNKPK